MSFHPFADLIGLKVEYAGDNESICTLCINDTLLNPHQTVHGGVLYSLADTGMGSALYPSLADGEICATIEIKINYFRPATEGQIICNSALVNRGRSFANVDSEIILGDKLLAKANGSFAILRRQ